MHRSKDSRFHHKSLVFSLRHDINHLLTCFNELDRNNTGCICRQTAKIFFRSIEVINYKPHLSSQNYPAYEFDHILSILGAIQYPAQPSIYVLAFIRLLAQFRNKCLEKIESSDLIQADQIDKKIERIAENQLHRQNTRLKLQKEKALQDIELNQNQKYRIYDKQWNSYIDEYGDQAKKKIGQTIDIRNMSLQNEQNKFAKTTRRYSVLTSTKLIELESKKKNLVKERKYNEALRLKQKISQEKQRIIEQQQRQAFFIASKRFESLKKKNQTIISATIMNVSNNIQKIIKKKQEGEQIIHIKMRTITGETIKKFNEKIRKQISRLKSLFFEASKG